MSATKLVLGSAKRASPIFTGGLNTNWATGKPYQFPAVNNAKLGEMQKKMAVFFYSEKEIGQYGLLEHDLLEEDQLDVAARVRKRMTQEQKDAMYFRMGRAILLSNTKRILPKHEWTPFDAPHHYMRDVINLVQKEDYEKRLTKAAQNDYDDNWERMYQLGFRIVNYMKIKAHRVELTKRFSESVV